MNKKPGPSRPLQMTIVFRLIAGGYLLYLTYGLIQELMKPDSERKLLVIAAAVLFAAVGGGLTAWCVKKLITGQYIPFGAVPDDGDEEEEPISSPVEQESEEEDQADRDEG
ncbi:hypothetical protein AALB16_13140 [Lachnospiraceae bacterium 62-35]